MPGIREYSVKSSGFITTDKQLVAGGGSGPGGVLHGIELISDGTHTCNVVIYHGTAATTGNELAGLVVAASTTQPASIVYNNPITAPDGLFVHPTGTGVTCIVYYSVGS